MKQVKGGEYMTVNIYADEMIFINFMSNFFIIEMTKKILKVRVSLLKESMASLCAGILYTLAVISDMRGYVNIISVAAFSALEMILLFTPSGIGQCIKYSMVMKFVSLCVNGAVLVMGRYINEGINSLVLMAGFALTYVSYVFISIVGRNQAYYTIDIKWCNKTINLNAFVDTGNYLVEPLSRKPVIVTEYSALKDVLPDKLVEIYEKKRESNLMEIISALTEDSLRKNMRIIPFKSVGNEKGIMIGFVADSVRIKDNVIKKPVIGICRFNLSRNGLYSALISPEHLGGI